MKIVETKSQEIATHRDRLAVEQEEAIAPYNIYILDKI